jgi:hypothetical protein
MQKESPSEGVFDVCRLLTCDPPPVVVTVQHCDRNYRVSLTGCSPVLSL